MREVDLTLNPSPEERDSIALLLWRRVGMRSNSRMQSTKTK